jgi:hypothetical protein
MHRLIVALAATIVVVLAAPAAYADDRDDAAAAAANWIASQQTNTGAFFFNDQDPHETGKALAAVIAGGASSDVIDNALGYIRTNGDRVKRGSYLGRMIGGIVAAGGDPSNLGGVNYVGRLKSKLKDSGAYDANFFGHFEAANGLLAAGEDVPDKAIDYITSNECDGGGFGYDDGCPKGPDVDSTSWAINVLVAADEQDHPAVSRARSFLLASQKSDGGWGFTKDEETSADSIGLALAAIEALGEEATSSPWLQPSGNNPLAALFSLQNSDGSFRKSPSASDGNMLATTNALPGLAGLSYPIPKGRPRSSKPPPSNPDPNQPAPVPTAAGNAPVVVRADPTTEPQSEAERAESASRRQQPAASGAMSSASPDDEQPTELMVGNGTGRAPDPTAPISVFGAPFADTAQPRSGNTAMTVLAWTLLAGGVGGAVFGGYRIRRSRF